MTSGCKYTQEACCVEAREIYNQSICFAQPASSSVLQLLPHYTLSPCFCGHFRVSDIRAAGGQSETPRGTAAKPILFYSNQHASTRLSAIKQVLFVPFVGAVFYTGTCGSRTNGGSCAMYVAYCSLTRRIQIVLGSRYVF